jgi:hypothetical protein
MLPLSIFPVGLIVLALAACGVTTLPTPRSTAHPALRCGLIVTERGGQLQINGQVQATAPVAGSYALSIAQTGRAGQNLINQSGDFSARAGEIVELGSASLSGAGADVNATLTLDYAGMSLTCPTTITH